MAITVSMLQTTQKQSTCRMKATTRRIYMQISRRLTQELVALRFYLFFNSQQSLEFFNSYITAIFFLLCTQIHSNYTPTTHTTIGKITNSQPIYVRSIRKPKQSRLLIKLGMNRVPMSSLAYVYSLVLGALVLHMQLMGMTILARASAENKQSTWNSD